jgi:Rap1a immunity proteins
MGINVTNVLSIRSCIYSVAICISLMSSSPPASAQQTAGWPTTGRDLYAQCASENLAIAHACTEFLLGFMYGVVGALPANRQILCPPSTLSFMQMETLYINWAKANPTLLNHQAPWAAGAALSAAFPCR